MRGKDVICRYCERPAKLVAGDVIYPHMGNLHELLFWYCAPCLAWVGTHKGTERPLGELANAPLRSIRNKAHRQFDPLWKLKMDVTGMSKKQARGRGYRWLAGQMGIEAEDCHIALMTEENCKRVIEICEPHAKRLREARGNVGNA